MYTPYRGVSKTMSRCFVDLTTVLQTPFMGFRSPSLGTLHTIYGKTPWLRCIYLRYTQNTKKNKMLNTQNVDPAKVSITVFDMVFWRYICEFIFTRGCYRFCGSSEVFIKTAYQVPIELYRVRICRFNHFEMKKWYILMEKIPKKRETAIGLIFYGDEFCWERI